MARECRTTPIKFQIVLIHFIYAEYDVIGPGASRAPPIIPRMSSHRRRPIHAPRPAAPWPRACSATGGGASRRRARTASPRSAPLLSVLLFLAAIISAFWYLRNEEIERETESVKRDTEIAQQQIRLRLIENQEQLVRMARELVTARDRRRRVHRPGRRLHARAAGDHPPDLGRRAGARVKASHWAMLYHLQPGRRDAPRPSLPADGRRTEPETGLPRGARHAPAGLLARLRRQRRRAGVPAAHAAASTQGASPAR